MKDLKKRTLSTLLERATERIGSPDLVKTAQPLKHLKFSATIMLEAVILHKWAADSGECESEGEWYTVMLISRCFLRALYDAGSTSMQNIRVVG